MVLLCSASPAPAAAASMPPGYTPRIIAAEQRFYWEWSDGTQQQRRTFTQAEYGLQSNLPHLVVTAKPSRPTQFVYLQYFQDGAWETENKVSTNARGIASIDLDPYCSDDTWCNATFKYRLKVGGQTARLTITYSDE